jgi:nucleoredoxin
MIYKTLTIIAIFSLSVLSGRGEGERGFQDLFPGGLIDGEGNPVSLEVLEGKAVGVYFSAHWCAPCRRFTPKLVAYRDAHRDDFEVVFVSGDRSEKKQFAYMKSAGMKWPAVRFQSRASKTLMERFVVEGFPTLVMVNAKGVPLTADGTTFVLKGDGAAKLKSASIVKEPFKCSKCDKTHYRPKMVFADAVADAD